MSIAIEASPHTPDGYGLSLNHAALIAGYGLLIVSITAPFAQFYAFPNLLDATSPAATVQNLVENRSLFSLGIMSYLLNYTFDIVVAWAFYVLFSPINRALSLLAFVFCLVYIAMALTGLLNYVEVFRLLGSSEAMAAMNPEQLNGQVYVLFNSYQYDWGFSLLLFGVVLLLRGYLVIVCNYIPAIYGYLLISAGFGYIVYVLGIYIAPDINLTIVTLTFAAEPVFMLWLIFKGGKLSESATG